MKPPDLISTTLADPVGTTPEISTPSCLTYGFPAKEIPIISSGGFAGEGTGVLSRTLEIVPELCGTTVAGEEFGKGGPAACGSMGGRRSPDEADCLTDVSFRISALTVKSNPLYPFATIPDSTRYSPGLRSDGSVNW